MTWSRFLFQYYACLQPPKKLPAGIEWLYPQQQPEVMKVVKAFLDKFYNDKKPRILLFGINPGRFGAGVTGVNFTAPRQLVQCGIQHNFKNQSELSAEFIYEMIEAFGGPEIFYGKFFITSVSPLGFVKDGKNINYYDDPSLQNAVESFIIKSITDIAAFHVNRSRTFIIGGEKNFKYFSKLNEKFQWFESIHALPHPRFIMQYKRKEKQQFIQQYVQLLKENA